jgi:hypothetical protein
LRDDAARMPGVQSAALRVGRADVRKHDGVANSAKVKPFPGTAFGDLESRATATSPRWGCIFWLVAI